MTALLRSSEMTSQGKLFVFEGPDQVGKTTLAQQLVEYLSGCGIPCQYLAFPGRKPGTLGHHIYELHHNKKNLDVKSVNATSLQTLHIAAHIDAIEQQILPTLNGGTSIVLDRYWWSTLVYGEVYGANTTTLQILVNAELVHWKEVKPDQIFLVLRPEPLSAEERKPQWDNLASAYMKLAEQQKDEASVAVISNINTLQESLGQITTVVEKIISTKKK